jgi:hypothetical protein
LGLDKDFFLAFEETSARMVSPLVAVAAAGIAARKKKKTASGAEKKKQGRERGSSVFSQEHAHGRMDGHVPAAAREQQTQAHAHAQALPEQTPSRLHFHVVAAGRAPTRNEMHSLLRTSRVFVYFGHGDGRKYYPHGSISTHARTPVVLLMGCSSGVRFVCTCVFTYRCICYCFVYLSVCSLPIVCVWVCMWTQLGIG